MTLEQQFRNGLSGQLSDDKTEVDIRVAVKIAREFSLSFSVFCADFGEYLGGQNYRKWSTEDDIYTMEEMLKTFEYEIYGK